MKDKDKLVRTKRTWAEKEQHLSGKASTQERLPPGPRQGATAARSTFGDHVARAGSRCAAGYRPAGMAVGDCRCCQ